MYYLRNVLSDVKLKYRTGRVVFDCVTKREQREFQQYLTECTTIADSHAELVLSTLLEYLSFSHPEHAYGSLLLLEQLVSLCNYVFHLALAKDYNLQDRIIQLAIRRGEGEAHRKAQRLARLTLLEYSRVFVDDRELLRLSSLASSFEHRTGKSLLRCLNVQNRRVRFRDVAKEDIIAISPKEHLGSTTLSTSHTVTPLHLSSAPEVWPCHVCTYLNAPSATRCAACETLRSADSISHRATPQTTPHLVPTPVPPASPSSPSSCGGSPMDDVDARDEEKRVEGQEGLEGAIMSAAAAGGDGKGEEEHSNGDGVGTDAVVTRSTWTGAGNERKKEEENWMLPPAHVDPHVGPPAASVFLGIPSSSSPLDEGECGVDSAAAAAPDLKTPIEPAGGEKEEQGTGSKGD